MDARENRPRKKINCRQQMYVDFEPATFRKKLGEN